MRVGAFVMLAIASACLAIIGNLQAVLFTTAAAFWWHTARQEWRKDNVAKARAREALRSRILGRAHGESACNTSR